MSFKTTALILGFALLTLTVSMVARAGGQDTGGGNVIQCDDGKMYSWDFVNAKLSQVSVDPAFLAAKSADEILAIISQRLYKFNRRLADSLDSFRKFNTDPLDEGPRLWINTTNPLINLGDEDRTQIPVSCVANAKPDFHLYQAVIRRQAIDGGKVRYQADQKLLQGLAANSPVQLSFLYIHEWLRDYSKNASDIDLADQLLHDSKIYTFSAALFNRTLSNIGVQFPNDARLYFIKPGKYYLMGGYSTILTHVEIIMEGHGLRL